MARNRHRKYPAVEYWVCLCEICSGPMSYQEVRQGVYWLPDMDEWEHSWARFRGFEHRVAHRLCWQGLKEKRRELIRLCSYKDQVPRVQGQTI